MNYNTEHKIEPTTELVLAKSKQILQTKQKQQITVKDIVDVLPVCEASIRKSLNELIDNNLLSVIPGRGRRPAFYSLPKIAINNQELLKRLQTKYAELLKEEQEIIVEQSNLKRQIFDIRLK